MVINVPSLMRGSSIFTALVLSILIYAAVPVKTICGDYTYIVPENVSREEAKRIAAERARIEALAAEYGTIVSQDNTTYISSRNGKGDVVFQSLGGSDVRGEWLSDIEEPTYRFSVDERTGETAVYARVCGKAREITRSEVPLQVRVLRNGIQPNHESEAFRAGDDLYVSFLSPVGGYVAVFLMDEDGQAVCMLPYQSQAEGAYAVAADREYVFFAKEQASQAERPIVDEYVMTCAGEQETDYLYLVFSTQPFSKPAMPSGVMGFEDFHAWRVRLLKRDEQAQVLQKTIIIRK